MFCYLKFLIGLRNPRPLNVVVYLLKPYVPGNILSKTPDKGLNLNFLSESESDPVVQIVY